MTEVQRLLSNLARRVAELERRQNPNAYLPA